MPESSRNGKKGEPQAGPGEELPHDKIPMDSGSPDTPRSKPGARTDAGPFGRRRAEKYFTVAEANAMLPRLEQQLASLQRVYRRARYKYIEMKKLEAIGFKEDGTPIMAYDYRLARQNLEELLRRVNDDTAAINAHGCRLKNIEMGLIDFPSIMEGEEVLLCWRQGEAMVSYYHTWESGYRGRKPLPHNGT